MQERQEKMEQKLTQILEESRPLCHKGKVATYIPELAKAPPGDLGFSVYLDDVIYDLGDYEKRFSMQSVSKVVSLALALEHLGSEKVFKVVGTSPSADPFNSIMRLEMDGLGRPLNPFINSGAIRLVSLLAKHFGDEYCDAELALVKKFSNNSNLYVDEAIYLSEKQTGTRNRALAYFLQSMGQLDGDVEAILDSYFRQCSIMVCCRDLAIMGATLALDGKNPITGEQICSPSVAKTVRGLMATCGLYNGSGDFAVRVGIPSKSGVGGGIVGAATRRGGIGVYGSALDPQGNSMAGVKIMELLSERLDLRVL